MEHSKERITPRGSGMDFSIPSVDSRYGCGNLGPETYKIIDHMSKAGMQYWGTRPLNPTGVGNSPYQALSSFAGNPYLISPELLNQKGLLTEEECQNEKTPSVNKIDYGWLYENRRLLLYKAYLHFQEQGGTDREEYRLFLKEHEDWLEHYAEFMSLKTAFNGEAWNRWPDPYRKHEAFALKQWHEAHRDDIEFWYFVQYEFFSQWKMLHHYARKKNIRIIGDIPFYISWDSADVWAEPELFMVDEWGQMIISGGVPGDRTNPAVRNWGMPAYCWKAHQKDHYKWWQRRIRIACRMFDGIRLDHVIGFVKWYAIPKDESKAKWRNGPDAKHPVVLKIIRDEAAKHGTFVIAEDLGVIPPGLREMMERMGIMGTRVMQFAFSNRYRYESNHLPFYHNKNMVLYTGNHDLPTLKEYLESKTSEETRYMEWWLRAESSKLQWNMIREACKSSSKIVLIPVQDVLEIGSEGRLVDPVNWENSWRWKLTEADLIPEESLRRLRAIAILTGRCALTEAEKDTAFEEALQIEEVELP